MKKNFTEKFIGVDIGGSHITVAEINSANSTIKPGTKLRRYVDSLGASEMIIESWKSILSEVINKEDICSIKIGIAMPGPFDYKQGISYIKDLNKYDALFGMNIKEILARELSVPSENFSFRNDAEAFLSGEVKFLKIESEKHVIGITLGTGLGSAVSFRGETRDVFKAIIPMNDSIAEDYISTRWFQKRYLELTGASLKDVKQLIEIDNEEVKEKIFNEFGDNLGRFIKDFVMEEKADIVILGGNIANCLKFFQQKMLAQLAENVQVIQSSLWEDAALIGATSDFY